MSIAEQTINRLLRTMTTSECLNINTMVVSRIRILRAKKLKEKKDMLKIGDKVTFKVTKSPSYVLKCRGWKVGVVLSIARSYAQVRVGSKTFKVHISALEKTNHEEGSWFEKPGVWIRNPEGAWPTLIELISKD